MIAESKKYSRYFTYIQPVIRSPIIKTYGSTIFTLLVLAIFVFFAIKPTIETILVLQKKLTDQQEVLKKITQKSENLSLAKKNYREIDSNTKTKIQDAIPIKAELKSAIQVLEQAAIQNQASISALQIQPLVLEEKDTSKPSQTLTEISFNFNVEGPYEKMVAILQQLKLSRRVVLIDSLIFNKTEGSNVLMSIAGKVYYLK